MAQFRFLPRYRGVALLAIGVGGSLAAFCALSVSVMPMLAGVIGAVFGAAYVRSPTWKLTLVIDDDGLAVTSPRGDKLRLAWSEVVAVTASPSTSSCFINGGTPARSFLVPGDGAPAPYNLEDKAAAYQAILAHVAADKVTIVESLDAAPAASA